MIWADSTRPKPIDWHPSFRLKDKIPFGLYIFNEESPKLFDNQTINKFESSPYELFNPLIYTEDTNYPEGTIMSIGNEIEYDNESLNELLNFVDSGNKLFVSANSISKNLLDTLKIKTDYFTDYNSISTNKLINQKQNFAFKKEGNTTYFKNINTNATRILGTLKFNNYELPNYVVVNFGDGKIYLHLQPLAFTNYYMLKNNSNYTASVCSVIDTKNIYWHIENIGKSTISDSPLRFILNQPPLYAAWLLLLFSYVLFILFNAKRRQRPIPIIQPVINTTIDFAKTIGNLYYLEKNHKNIAEKKIIYFLEKLRHDYFIDTRELNETFINRVCIKTGNDKALVQKLVFLIQTIKNASSINEKQLIELNQTIENLNIK